MKKLHISCSPLTGTIYAGTVLKNGLWSVNKQDLTLEALIAVAEHVKKFGKPVEISDSDGCLIYRISVEH